MEDIVDERLVMAAITKTVTTTDLPKDRMHFRLTTVPMAAKVEALVLKWALVRGGSQNVNM